MASAHPRPRPPGDETTRQFFDHSAAERVNTDAVIARALKKQYPDLELVIVPSLSVDLLSYAAAGHAGFTRLDDAEGTADGLPSSLIWKTYVPPARRLDGGSGALAQTIAFAKFLYRWRGDELILYLVDGRDGTINYPQVRNSYLLTADPRRADALLVAAGHWTSTLHDQVWVFDNGWWQKSAELYRSVTKASWDNVILDPAMKRAIIEDHLTFFSSRATYDRLQVPWKRGLLYHGPPGNGKTISIKAMMHTLYTLPEPIPALYVRNLTAVSFPLPPLRRLGRSASGADIIPGR